MAGAAKGGAELFFERLAIAQHRAGDDVLAAIRPDPDRVARLMAAGLVPAPVGYHHLDPRTRPRLRGLLTRFAPRVAVAWMNRAAAVTPRGDWVLVGRLGGYYDLRHYRACEHLVGNTRGIARWLVEKGWPERRVHYLPNFADDFSGAVPADRMALGVPAGAPLLLGLGRLHRDKAFDVLIRALPRLPNAHAVIAGEGPERAALLRLASAEGVAGRVHLIGWRTDVAALLAACDVFVCSSRLEPLGNMVIEAWSASRPVVAADSYGPAELLTDGRDGLLVPMEDAAALAAALARVLDDPSLAAALAAAGRARFASEFAAAPVLARWRDFLGNVEKI